ncbi:hypothetical protein [Neisseria animaloris]|uniref:hypothetical protein n=1 Tax=Neisseria animaloris TaxID=326522 RepID=UPI001301CF02|nr:hypothetical protein [Neisseria animaloris]
MQQKTITRTGQVKQAIRPAVAEETIHHQAKVVQTIRTGRVKQVIRPAVAEETIHHQAKVVQIKSEYIFLIKFKL